MGTSAAKIQPSSFLTPVLLGIGAALGIFMFSVSAHAAEQVRINQVDGEVSDSVKEYREILDRLQELRGYNANKSAVTKDQELRISIIDDDIARIESWKSELPDLMEEMISLLEEFVAADIPFRKSERAFRLEGLRLHPFGVPETAEEEVILVAKFHKVLEAIQIENDYGRSIESYEGIIETGDESFEVDFLMVGRVALFYQAKEGLEIGMWDHGAGAWVTDLPSGAGDHVRTALAVAEETIPPNILLLPLPAPQDP